MAKTEKKQKNQVDLIKTPKYSYLKSFSEVDEACDELIKNDTLTKKGIFQNYIIVITHINKIIVFYKALQKNLK